MVHFDPNWIMLVGLALGLFFGNSNPLPTQMALKFGGGSASPLVKCRSAIG